MLDLTSSSLALRNTDVDDVSRIDDSTWVLSNTIDNGTVRPNVVEFARLHDRNITFPSGEYVKAFKTLGLEGRVRWWNFIPKHVYMRLLHDLRDDIVSIFRTFDTDYYTDVYKPTRRILDVLRPMKVDVDVYTKYITDDTLSENDVVHVRSFEPDESGFARKVSYDAISSRTGRLTVVDGPRIATLRRGMRDIITSRWTGGSIVVIDYVSLEARLAMVSAGLTPEYDVYEMVMRDLGLVLPRDAVKRAVLMMIYGAGLKTLSEYFDDEYATWLLRRVKAYFKVDAVVDMIRRTYDVETSTIRNLYGRYVPTVNDDRILYNSYMQSSCVDIALCGFTDIVHRLAGLRSVPIAIVHDALFIDVHPDELSTVTEVVKIPHRVRGTIDFPLSMSCVHDTIV